ncbi:MAG: DUF3516 domain-containing protein, partial [Bdellovibrionales bacterium]|nr:DUF3516 domain-containing protein [Bdellovibrionales bacterium]
RDLCADFGAEQVGMITGDGNVNPSAPIICCTAEILSNLSLREGENTPVDDVVIDEFHYYSDKQRGVAWQIPILTMKKSRFLLMSATLGDMDFFAKALTDLNAQPTEIVRSTDRPVPLDFEYREIALHETVAGLVEKNLSPVYLVNFSQREAAEEAQNLLSVDFSSKDEKKKIAEALEGIKFQSPYGKEMQKLLRHGIGLHHAGLLPKYRVMVERLAQKGLLKVISGTDTLGVGVNVPIRTVLFTKLCKYDGEKTSLLNVRDFQQISGRAGRRGFDTRGLVVAQAPEHVIENLKLKSKAAGDPKKARKIVLKTPPPQGFVMWTQDTFNKLIGSQPEPLVSRFQVSHGMLLNVLSRETDGCVAMKSLIRSSHGTPVAKKQARRSSFELFRALLDRKIVEYIPNPEPGRAKVRVHVDLQDDFSLNQALSLYLLDTVKVLDLQSETYALDTLTLVESILENPEVILRKQLDRVKTAKMAELKASGMEYDQRIEELEKLEYPKPNRDFIYSTFNIFAAAHPWIGQENIRPKSIAREMYENYHSFADYIREYDLHRVEGLLLRYLSDVYKVLMQSVPEASKTEEIRAIAIYFGTMIRQTDSSLLDDWEKMRQASLGTSADLPGAKKTPSQPIAAPETAHDITSDKKSFTLLVRNEVFRVVRALANRDYEEAFALLDSENSTISREALETKMKEYVSDHGHIYVDPAARHPKNTQILQEANVWRVSQRLMDSNDHNDWDLNFEIDLAASKIAGAVRMKLISIQSV